MSTHHKTTDLVVGLDYQTIDRAMECVDSLNGYDVLYQVGLELFMHGGSDLLRELAHRKKRVFLDLKFMDSPEVAAKAVQLAALCHVEVLSLHLGGGSSMIRAVKQGLEDIPLFRPRLLGVGVLSFFDDVRWAEVTRAFTGHALKIADSFEMLLDCAFNWGLDGVTCSLTQLERVRNLYPNLYTLVTSNVSGHPATQGELQTLALSQARHFGADAILLPASFIAAACSRADVSGFLGGLGFSAAQV